MPDGFRSAYDVRVRFAETDAQGIAHHAAFVVWLEVARVAYLADHAGGYRGIQAQGIEALTTGVRLDYHAAVYFDDVLTVHLRCVDVRGARFRYDLPARAGGRARRERRDAPCHGRRDDQGTDACSALVRGGDRYGRAGAVTVGSGDVLAPSVAAAGPVVSPAPFAVGGAPPLAAFFPLAAGLATGSFVPTRTRVGSPT